MARARSTSKKTERDYAAPQKRCSPTNWTSMPPGPEPIVSPCQTVVEVPPSPPCRFRAFYARWHTTTRWAVPFVGPDVASHFDGMSKALASGGLLAKNSRRSAAVSGRRGSTSSRRCLLWEAWTVNVTALRSRRSRFVLASGFCHKSFLFQSLQKNATK